MVFPKIAILETTYNCNHGCLFCSSPWYAPSEKYTRRSELSIEQWFRVIDRLIKLGVKQVTFSGGEVLLKCRVEEMIHYAFQKSLKLGIISNGYKMTDYYLDTIAKYNMHLSMSIPGLSTFKTLTCIDNHKNVLKWFSNAKKAGISTTANITVTKKNLHELYETIAEVILAGASSILLNRFLPGGRGLTYMNELQLNINEINEMLDIAEEVLGYAGMYGYTGTEIPLCLIDDLDKYKHIQISSQCGAAREFVAIDPAGYIRVCNHSEHKIGNILDANIITDNDYWNRFINKDYKPQYCNDCKYYDICDCGCREVANIINGDLKMVDPCINIKI